MRTFLVMFAVLLAACPAKSPPAPPTTTDAGSVADAAKAAKPFSVDAGKAATVKRD